MYGVRIKFKSGEDTFEFGSAVMRDRLTKAAKENGLEYEVM